MSQPFLIDTDVGSDDAVALMMALRSPVADVIAITTVSGNVPVGQATTNALIVNELCGVDVPVYPGAAKPLLRPYVDATFFHGVDGLGDQNYPQPQQRPQEMHAVDAIIKTAKNTPGLVIVTLGPLTNLALAIQKAPEIIPNIARCVVMGGAACTYGNVTAAAEYNIWVDPDAARITFLSGLEIEMVGWELCKDEYALTPDEIAHVRSLDTPYGHFAVDCNITAIEAFKRQTGQIGLSLPDPVTMAVALDPSIVTDSSKHYVDVEIHSDLTRGMTVVDRLNVAKDPRNATTWKQVLDTEKPISVTWSVDVRRWKKMLYGLLS